MDESSRKVPFCKFCRKDLTYREKTNDMACADCEGSIKKDVILKDNGVQEIRTTRIKDGKKSVYFSASTAAWRKHIFSEDGVKND